MKLDNLPGFRYFPRARTARISVVLPGTRGRIRRRRKLIGVTRDEGLAAWKEMREQLLQGKKAPTDPLFSVYWKEFGPAMLQRLGRKTAKNQASIVTTVLLPFFGDVRLSRVNLALLKDFIASLRSRGLAPASINGRLSVLRKILHDAEQREAIETFPIKGRWPREKEPPIHNELSEDEMRAFLDAFDHEDAFQTTEDFQRFRAAKPLFVVALETGLSRSDLLGLRWGSVDLEAGWIRVPRQKTGIESTVPISDMCREALEECRRRPVVGEYVFLTERAQRFSVTTFGRYFRRAKKIAGFPASRHLRIHDLRHSFGSRLASAGVSLQVISRCLGHASVRMSERYARPNEEAFRSVVSALRPRTLPENRDESHQRI